jgi:hypothetical protein
MARCSLFRFVLSFLSATQENLPSLSKKSLTPSRKNCLNPKGVKGAHPLGCLPLWGREGVTLIIAAEDYRITG